MWNQIEDDDTLLEKALEESLRHYHEVELPRTQASPHNNEELPQNGWAEADFFPQPSTSKQPNYAQQSTSNQLVAEEQTLPKSCASPEKLDLYEGEEAEGFDLQAGKTWLYPTNYPIREYQRSIVVTALFHNTLVSLPTGLGKTFIAAVVMYNFYKWYPKGKVIFMAPTKPLVAQQVEQCYNTMGIPRIDTAEMTGALPSKDRGALWRGKRVFFLTPQVVQNDLSSGICPATAVKCVVIDEAHRATGEYAYCQVVKLLQSFGGKFRVLALSATPGSDLTAVQKVVNSLMISHIEIRNEDSPDLAAYTHERKIEIMSVSVGPIIVQIREKYLKIMGEYCRKLQTSKVLFGNIASLSSFQILKSWNEFKSNPPPGMSVDTARMLSADFSLLHTLAHGLDLLQNYGLRLLLTNISDVLNDPTNSSGARLKRNDELLALLDEVRTILDPPPDTTLAPSQPDFIYGHPKLDTLKDVIENHFKDFEARDVQTRVIVFCEYREAVIEIRQLLTALQPLVKPVGFMGQSAGKHGKGISQKNQLLVMEQFRKGFYNTLVSTSVGEEGLDIGEVDLIICYDAKNSPIRQVQRMGRTGRKRKGRIIVLVTEGKEELKFRSALAKKRNINAMLVEKDSLKGHLFDESPSMLPEGFQTECVERKIVIAPATTPLQQDLRKMFSKKMTNVAPNVPNAISENASVSDEELNQMLPEAMEDISKAEDYYKNLDLSRYLEWQRYLQYTHEVEHSTSSEIMRDLLSGIVGDQASGFQGLQTQISATQIWPGNKKRGAKRPATSVYGKRKKPRATSEKKPDKLASRSSSESSDECPVPSSFQIKPARANMPVVAPTKNNATHQINVTEQPDNHTSVATDFPVDQPFSPSEMDDDVMDSDDTDLDSEIRAALKKLRIAFRKEDEPLLEDDNCPVCSLLEPCQEIKKMANEEKPNPNLSWSRMEEMLKRVQTVLPRLTKDSFSLPTPPQSPVFVSMIPREEFQREGNFNFGIICGGVGDVSLSPLKESEIVQNHSDVSNPNAPEMDQDSFHSGGNVSVRSLLNESKIVKRHSDDSRSHSPGMDHLGEGTLLDFHLDHIFAKIGSQNCRNPREKTSPENMVTSPILGSQALRKPRSSQVTPTPKAIPKKSLFPIFQSANRTQNRKAPSISKESPPQKSTQRDIQLDFDTFLQSQSSQSPEEKAKSPEDQSICPALRAERSTELVQVKENGLSPVLSKSQLKSKQRERNRKELRPRTPTPEKKSKSRNSDCLSPVLSKIGPKNNQNTETTKEIVSFFEKSDDDMFAGLDIQQPDEVFNVSNAQKLDLDYGFMNKPEDVRASPTKEGHTHSAQKKDPPNLANLVWMDKSNGYNLAPPQNRSSCKLSLKKNSTASKKMSVLDKTKKTKQQEKSQNMSQKRVPDCFQLKKPPQSVKSTVVPKSQLKAASKFNAGDTEERFSSDDDFTRKFPDLPISPIPSFERPITPNCALDELVKNLIPVSPDNSPDDHSPTLPEVDNRKRLLSSSPSPEMPRKKQNIQVYSSPESPLIVKPKKGFKRPLDDTILDSSRVNGWLQAKESSKTIENESWTGKNSRRARLSESSDEEFFGRKERKTRKEKEPNERHKKSKEKKKSKTKKKSSRFAFLESQAVESDDEPRNSSDGEATSLDGLDSSFIDDSPDETAVDNGVDMQARYLQAVRSPAVIPNAFKIPHRSVMPFQGDVYSQAVDHNDYSCYMNDSFCVEEELEERSDPEMSLLELAEAQLKAEKKKRRKKEEKPQKRKKRSRIVRPVDSSESDDDVQIIETKTNENKQTETKRGNQNLIEVDTDLTDEWYGDDFDIPEINDLGAAGSSTKQSTSKSGPSFNQNLTSKSEPVQRTNTDDINQLLDDDFDFSKVGSVEDDIANAFVETESKKNVPVGGSCTSRDDSPVIFVSVRQVAGATEILRLLRISYKINISCRSSTSADYVISRRLGVCRISISDLKSNEKMEPIVDRLKESFARSVLIVENDKENRLLMATKTFGNKGNAPPPKTAQPEWTSSAITTIMHLRHASVDILFSDEKALTARLLADLIKGEQDAGFGISPVPVEFTNEMEKKLKFLTTIPGINIALAVHLVEKFRTIKSFISNCSKVKDIQRNVGVNYQIAQKIHNILFQVHMS